MAVVSESNGGGEEGRIGLAKALRLYREHESLRAFLRTKAARGVIATEHADEIEGIRDVVLTRHGIVRDPDDRRALHNNSQVEEEAAAYQEANQSMTQRLAELYPHLAEEVNGLFGGRPR